MLAEYKDLFHEWSVAVERAINFITDRVMPRRQIWLIEEDDKTFTAKMSPTRKGASLPDVSFRLLNDRPDPPLPADWESVLRGSRIEFLLRPDHVLFRSLDFPSRAVEFLDRIIRAQIDRLTPWAPHEAVFGWSPPFGIANDRIQLTLAATSKSNIQPLIQLADRLGATSAAVFAAAPAGEAVAAKFKVFEAPLRSATAQKDMPRVLRAVLFGSGLAALASLVVATYAGNAFDTEQQELLRRIADRRASLRLDQAAGSGSAQSLLVKRKQTTPSSVMVLEAISRALPDSTYVTELRIDGDKVQVVGISQDSPSLIRLMEQSPQFSSATFFAPTTRAQGDPGERFHIEAQLKAYFGSGT